MISCELAVRFEQPSAVALKRCAIALVLLPKFFRMKILLGYLRIPKARAGKYISLVHQRVNWTVTVVLLLLKVAVYTGPKRSHHLNHNRNSIGKIKKMVACYPYIVATADLFRKITTGDCKIVGNPVHFASILLDIQRSIKLHPAIHWGFFLFDLGLRNFWVHCRAHI